MATSLAARVLAGRGHRGTRRLLAVAAMSAMALVVLPAAGRAGPSGNDWNQYSFDHPGSNFTNETLITASNASTLKAPTGWPVKGGGVISARAIVANNLVYWGTWDGLEHATPIPGGTATAWSTPLGVTTGTCFTAGVASSPVAANVIFSGQSQPTAALFLEGGGTDSVGGGFTKAYALNALTGAIIWKTNLGPAPATMGWSSPVLANGHLYFGIASLGDCPLTPSGVVEVNAGSGAIEHTFNANPSGCTGSGVWGSPTIDDAAGVLYVVTGNPSRCKTGTQLYGDSIVALNASDLTVADHWAVPANEQVKDGDFGSVPTLFTGTVTPGGTSRKLVGATSKNGIFYVWDRANIHAGPVARLRVADSTSANISPAAYDGNLLYVASKKTTISGTAQKGAVRAFNPNNLSSPVWTTVLKGQVYAPVAAAPGLVVAAGGPYIFVLNSATGVMLKTLAVNTQGLKFYAGPTISHGVLYDGDTGGNLYAYRPGG